MNRMAYLFARKTYPVKEWSEILQEELAGFSWDVQEEKSGRKTCWFIKNRQLRLPFINLKAFLSPFDSIGSIFITKDVIIWKKFCRFKQRIFQTRRAGKY